MKSHSSIEIRRCRPLLGTFVEITVRGSDERPLGSGIEAAFAVVATVHRLMSFHDSGSDVARMNGDASQRPIKVHPWTWRVLKSAQEFSRNTDGIFDVTTAARLVKWNYLPRPGAHLGKGSWRDIILEPPGYVRFRRPLLSDLGGIAKGFAVDRAVEVLKRNGVTDGIVNAGGDLRAFGSASHIVHLRDPLQPNLATTAVRLRERAIATSGIYFARSKHRGRRVSPILDARTGRGARDLISVTVGAPNCLTADAMTKIVFALRERAAPLLQRYSADALLLEKDGSPSWMFHPTCDASRQT
jgi:thiamine biosynthesis lipoprotein